MRILSGKSLGPLTGMLVLAAVLALAAYGAVRMFGGSPAQAALGAWVHRSDISIFS